MERKRKDSFIHSILHEQIGELRKREQERKIQRPRESECLQQALVEFSRQLIMHKNRGEVQHSSMTVQH